MKLKFLIAEDNMTEQQKIKEILQKRGIEFKIFSNFNNAVYGLQEDGGVELSNPHNYTGVITDINFPVSENTDKERPFGFCLYKIIEKETKIPCIICTKNNAHDDNGWVEMMFYAMGIKDDNVVVDKNWEKAVEKLISKIKQKSLIDSL